jgi:hypothetical protein
MLFFKRACDIHSKKRGIAGRLSNFTRRSFLFDGVPCRSIEGVLQSFKFSSEEERRIVCGLWGIQAKLAGEGRNWREEQVLFWNGERYPRESEEYRALLSRLYGAVYEQDADFRRDLRRARGRRLAHSIGKSDPRETVLTE